MRAWPKLDSSISPPRRRSTCIVSRRGFTPFGWYRILVGGAALVWLAMR